MYAKLSYSKTQTVQFTNMSKSIFYDLYIKNVFALLGLFTKLQKLLLWAILICPSKESVLFW